jgi:glycosyltransferase involved in cell wall biosynthesis
VYTGSISAAQYIEEIIGAIALVGAPVQLDIAGPCSEAFARHLTQYIRDNGLEDSVQLHGRVSRIEAYELVERADVGFVFYNERSGAEAGDPAPNKLSDYIAGNTWMIGSDQPYIKYWLEERGAGEIIKVVTKEAIAQAIKNILGAQRYSDTAVLEHIYRRELNMNVQANKLLGLIGK